MSVVSMKSLLEAGVHFGHQTRRWNPKMKKFIFTERNGIYIIDLQKTVKQIEEAYKYVRDLVADGGTVMFVGTKKQAQEAIETEAKRAGQPYVSQRWLGGMLTNYKTIKSRIDRLNELKELEENNTFDLLPKKEVIQLHHEMERLEKYLGGVKNMKGLPDCLFIIDPKNESIAVNEARILGIPVVAVVDTNTDPDEIDIPIPGNDDAIRAVKLLTSIIADAVVEANQGAQHDDEQESEESEEIEEVEESEESKEDSEDFGEEIVVEDKEDKEDKED